MSASKSFEAIEENSNPFIQINRFEVEQSAVFIDFNSEEIINQLRNYQTLNIYHRISLAKNIATIRQISNGHQSYFRFLQELATDTEELQIQLIDFLRDAFIKIQPIAEFQREFINPLTKLIFSSHLEIKEESCELLSEISHRISAQERKQIFVLAKSLEKNEDEENRIISMQLIAKLTPDMQQQQIEAYFKSGYIGVYKQSSVRIKKEIIHSSSIIARSVSKEFLDRELIEAFLSEKCKENVWGIRKACIEVLPQFVVLTNSKKEHLAQILFNFTKDGNKMVKISAFKIIPEFIANYNSPKVPQKLIQIYVNLIDNQINHSLNRQNEIISKISFYFPGVMHNLGAGKWDVMKKLFNRLLFYKSNEVKMPIASSLHEISRIIGPQLSKEYMFTALDNILKDTSDLLKLTAISHLSQFVQLFEKTTRQNLIDVFLVLQKDPKKWRVRYQIAHQLNSLSKIYQTETVFKYIFPISLKLCNDSVSEVRFQAAGQMYFVIENMKETEMFQQMALQSIKGFGLSQKYTQRQTFSFMVRNIYQLNLFKDRLMDLILELTRDPIVTVRIALAISISQIILTDPQKSSIFNEVVEILREDEEDVRQYFGCQ